MFHKIIDVAPLPGMRLRARFEDGSLRLYDASVLPGRWPDFQSFIDIPGLFDMVQIEARGYAVAWNEFLDLSSEDIWEYGTPIHE